MKKEKHLKRFRSSFLSMIAGVCLMTSLSACSVEEHPADGKMNIGTAGKGGRYLPIGKALCAAATRNDNIKCEALLTKGTIANLKILTKTDKLDTAITRSDWVYHATQGTGPFEESGSTDDLRQVMNLYEETLVVAVRKSSDIKTIEDLKGKRINIGAKGSMSYKASQALFTALELTPKDLKSINYASGSPRNQGFCRRKFDAMIFAAVLPDEATIKTAAHCEMRLIPLSGDIADAIQQEHPYYADSVIKANMYSGNANEVPTLSLYTVLSTRKRTSAEEINHLINGVVGDIDGFRASNPLLMQLTRERMKPLVETAPLHRAVKDFF